jgi:hypothetical protein
VISRLCSRCQSVLHREDEGSLIFCWNCGAPQVRLSEELLDQIDKQIAVQEAGPSILDPLPSSAPGNSIIWRGAIQCAGLAGAIAAGFALIALALPPVDLLWFFWVVGSPAFVLAFYSSRFRQTRVTASFGARLGLLSGLAILLSCATLKTVHLLLMRFLFHSIANFDAQLAAAYAHSGAMVVQQYGAAAKPALDMLAVPEIRAGFLLSSAAIFFGAYLLFSATSGAFAGYLRARSSR